LTDVLGWGFVEEGLLTAGTRGVGWDDSVVGGGVALPSFKEREQRSLTGCRKG